MSRALRPRINSRPDRGLRRAAASTRREVPPVVSMPPIGPLTDRDVAERFSAKVVGFTPSQLAKAARCTKEGAKHWVNGSRCPSLPKVLEMARAMPAIRSWLIHEMGEAAGFEDDTRAVARLMAMIRKGDQ